MEYVEYKKKLSYQRKDKEIFLASIRGKYVILYKYLSKESFDISKKTIIYHNELKKRWKYTPGVVFIDKDRMLVALEYLGVETLRDSLDKYERNSILLRTAIKIIEFNKLYNPNESLEKILPKMDYYYFMKCISFFCEIFNVQWKDIDYLMNICEEISKLPRSLCHGDIHSENIILLNKDIYFIDFDRLAIGNVFYDLSCLFNDPYYKWSYKEINVCLREVTKKFNKEFIKNFTRYYKKVNFIRNLYTLATYIYIINNNSSEETKEKFKNHCNFILEKVLEDELLDEKLTKILSKEVKNV